MASLGLHLHGKFSIETHYQQRMKHFEVLTVNCLTINLKDLA